VKDLSFPQANNKVHSFEETHKSINYMWVKMINKMVLRIFKKKMKLKQRESSKFEWEHNV
jgi:hypothetical protein